MAKVDLKPVISRLAPELVARLDAYAAQRGLSRNAAMVQLITEGLDRSEPPRRASTPAKAKAKRTPEVVALPEIPTPRPRAPRAIGYHPITGELIYGR